MKGKYHIVIQNNAVQFKFDIDHNISVVKGNSATGKTTMIEMIRGYETNGTASGITFNCTPECRCHVLEGILWQDQLKVMHHTMIFVDEGNQFLFSEEFAKLVSKSDNYFVLFTRHGLPQLPYSVDAVYEIKKSGKYGKLKTTYNHFSTMYSSFDSSSVVSKNEVDTVLTEDSHSGYQFWKYLSSLDKIECISSRGKTKLYSILLKLNKRILIVADGAAIGPEMEKLALYIERHPSKVYLYLPESFEWILLKSEFPNENKIINILKEPYNYIDSTKYESWEQFFTALLIRKTKGSYNSYQKNKLNPYYKEDGQVKKIRSVMKESGIEL